MVRNKRPPNTAACDTAYLTGPVEQKPQFLVGCRTEATVSSLLCGPLRHGGLLHPSVQAERPGARERASKKEAIASGGGCDLGRVTSSPRCCPLLEERVSGRRSYSTTGYARARRYRKAGTLGSHSRSWQCRSPGRKDANPGFKPSFFPEPRNLSGEGMWGQTSGSLGDQVKGQDFQDVWAWVLEKRKHQSADPRNLPVAGCSSSSRSIPAPAFGVANCVLIVGEQEQIERR